jgi:soluble lytic murein transglycosylase-like protein
MLSVLGWLGASCQLPTWTASDPAGAATASAVLQALPPVGAAPPWVASPAEAPVDEPDLSTEAGILAELRSRHTALADHELVALARTIVEESERHGFDPALVMAVIHVESGGYHLAVSHVGALGLMQLMPPTGEELAEKLDLPWHGPDTLFDPVLNVKLGVAYLRQLADRYDNVPTALAAYNWGPGRIDRRIRRGATVPSRYIEQVMRAWDVDPNIRPAGRS